MGYSRPGCRARPVPGTAGGRLCAGRRQETVVKPTYFDLTVVDLASAMAFFERVLQWRFEKFDMPYEHYR